MHLWQKIAVLFCTVCVSSVVVAQDYRFFSVELDDWVETEEATIDEAGNYTVGFESEDKSAAVAVAVVMRPLDGKVAAQTTADFLAAQGYYVSEVTTDFSGVYYFTATDIEGTVDHVLVKGNGEMYSLITARGDVDEADAFIASFSNINEILAIPLE